MSMGERTSLIVFRFKKALARAASSALVLIEFPLDLLWACGPGLIWRDNPATGPNSPTARIGSWLYDVYVRADRRGWNGE